MKVKDDENAIGMARVSAGHESDYESHKDPQALVATKPIGGGHETFAEYGLIKLGSKKLYTCNCIRLGRVLLMKGELKS